MRLGPGVPFGHGLSHDVEEVIDAAVADEFEATLEIGGDRLVVPERRQMALEPAGALEIEDRACVVDDRRDLRPAADHPLVVRDVVDLAVAHPRDPFHLEAVERFGDARPLRVDDAPADAGLKDTLAELLEIVVDALRDDLFRCFHGSAQYAEVNVDPFTGASLRNCYPYGPSSRLLGMAPARMWVAHLAQKEQAMARKAGGGMTVAEAGRMGGRLVSEKYGPEFYEKIGKKGGSSTATKYGPEFFGRIGKKGGRAVTAKYGAGHFERIGRKGGQKVADLIERAKTLETPSHTTTEERKETPAAG